MTSTAIKLQQTRQELITVLGSSLYVGAKPESIIMVLDYCAAAGLDPMQKPVHIVPMNTRNPVSGNYEWRDVIMPGIGHYRIQADRAGTMAGISEPEFGPDISQEFTNKNNQPVNVDFPEWCRVAVKKLVGGNIVEFVAREYWIENYATDSGKSTAPNAMWKKRPRGQLAKCAEAQALRKAFPEIGAQPSAEEMEGKTIELGDAVVIESEPKELQNYPDDTFNERFQVWQEMIESGKNTPVDIIAKLSTVGKLSVDQFDRLHNVTISETKAEPEPAAGSLDGKPTDIYKVWME